MGPRTSGGSYSSVSENSADRIEKRFERDVVKRSRMMFIKSSRSSRSLMLTCGAGNGAGTAELCQAQATGTYDKTTVIGNG